jgi:uncharacterized protein YbbK (DUF523 family)
MRGISACLLGLACRYDGSSRPSRAAQLLAANGGWVPFCPEQLGGLPTPRPPAEIVGGDGSDVLAGRARVINARGNDVTAHFLRGACEAAALCTLLGLRAVVLKARSPSCGAGTIRRSGELVPGDGVTTAMLRSMGIEVTEHQE